MSDYPAVPSPAFVLDEELLENNLKKLIRVREGAGVDMILAFKGFAMWKVFPTVSKYLEGATASSLHEARLCFDEMGCKAHTYMVAYNPNEFDQIAAISSHITFNSLRQFELYRARIPNEVSIGLRVNPEWSDVKTSLYDPSDPTSRLGMTVARLPEKLPAKIDGLHFHVLCESSAESLQQVLDHFEQKFHQYLSQIKWVNMGGGHLISGKDYNIQLLIEILVRFREKYGVQVILEPGSAIAWETGYLVGQILDIVENGGVKTAVTNVSFTCHMPDCLEMPYRPKIRNANEDPTGYKNRYRIGGLSCLAGDFLEEYGFDHPLKAGDLIIFQDMMHYTMVKTTTFNGIQHPAICIRHKNGAIEVVREFGYEDYRNRLS